MSLIERESVRKGSYVCNNFKTRVGGFKSNGASLIIALSVSIIFSCLSKSGTLVD